MDATSSCLETGNQLLTVPILLRNAANTYEKRNAIYSVDGVDNYKEPFGTIMSSLQMLMNLRPETMTTDDWSRLGLLSQIVYKLTRYATQFNNGGHYDSAHDICVYAAMLEEITEQASA